KRPAPASRDFSDPLCRTDLQSIRSDRMGQRSCRLGRRPADRCAFGAGLWVLGVCSRQRRAWRTPFTRRPQLGAPHSSERRRLPGPGRLPLWSMVCGRGSLPPRGPRSTDPQRHAGRCRGRARGRGCCRRQLRIACRRTRGQDRGPFALDRVRPLAMLLSFVQPYVALRDPWKKRWVVLLLVGSVILPVFVLLEMNLGLVAGGIADLGGLLVIIALTGMLVGVLRYGGRLDLAA